MSDTETATPQPAPPSDDTARSRRRDPHPVIWLAIVVVVLAIVIVGVVGVAFGRNSQSGASTNAPATITVTGTGPVQGTPDTLSFNIGVDTVRADAVLALSANNAQMQALERTLLRYGVLKQDLQTSNLDIYQRTDDHGNVIGWEVNDSLNVSIHNMAKAGVIIDAAARQASNNISFGGVSFSISNESRYLAAARREAMQSAMTEASQLAAGASRTVTGIVKVTDQENAQQPIVYPFAALRAASADTSVPIQAGRQPVNVQVTVVYSLSS